MVKRSESEEILAHGYDKSEGFFLGGNIILKP